VRLRSEQPRPGPTAATATTPTATTFAAAGTVRTSGAMRLAYGTRSRDEVICIGGPFIIGRHTLRQRGGRPDTLAQPKEKP
jgi:hypothetical protein